MTDQKYLTIRDLLELYPFSRGKLNQVIKAGIFVPMRDPVSGKRPIRGQKMIFMKEQCDAAMKALFLPLEGSKR